MRSGQNRGVNSSIEPRGIDIPLHPLPVDQTIDGRPSTGAAELPGPNGLALGIWEHTPGTSTDVETDEVFVVVAGRATVVLPDGERLEFGPGDIGTLDAGTPTTWIVHETLRKVYVLPDT